MITIKDITNKFQEIYYMPDPTPLRMVIATTLSSHMDGSPVWLMIVASSGTGKTELLRVVSKVNGVQHLSNITENTLLSGTRAPNRKSFEKSKQEDVSLLKRIPEQGATFVWPEFNTLLDERSEKKAAIISQLRAVYDGELVKMTGLGDTIKWKGKVALIGACTEKFFADMEKLDAAGPRFTIYSLKPLNNEQQKERLKKVKKNEHLFEQTQDEIQNMVKEFHERKCMEGIKPHIQVPELFDNIINEISSLLGIALTAVHKDYKGMILDVYEPTDGTRFYRAARKLAQAMMLLEEEEELLETDEDSIIKLLFDTIPRRRHRVLSVASQYEEINTKALAHHLHLPTDSVRDVLEELNAIGMVVRRAGEGGEGDIWSVKPMYRDIMIKYEDGTEWVGGTKIETSNDVSDGSNHVLKNLSAFKVNSDDTAYSQEVAKNEDERLERNFNMF